MSKAVDIFDVMTIVQVPVELTQNVKLAVASTFQSIFNAEPVDDCSKHNDNLFDGIVGIISFVGDLTWSISLGLPRKTASVTAQKFTGLDLDCDSEDMGDLVAELVNIVAGDVISRLDSIGISTEMSLPSTARGRDMRLLIPNGKPTHYLNFAYPEGCFWLQISIDNNKHKQSEDVAQSDPCKWEEQKIQCSLMSEMDENSFPLAQVDCVKQAVEITLGSIDGEGIVYQGAAEEKFSSEVIIGFISIVCKKRSWTLMLGLPRETASDLAKQFTGYDIDYNNDDMGDIVGELNNIIAGDVVARWDAIGMTAEMSIPTIARGRNMETLPSSGMISMQMNFKGSFGSFWLKLATTKVNEK